nr:putative CaTx Tcis32 [Tityus cisandinus]
MNLRYLIIIGLLLATAACCLAKSVGEEARGGCNKLGKKCNSDSDCCRYGEQCLSSGSGYYCKLDPGP